MIRELNVSVPLPDASIPSVYISLSLVPSVSLGSFIDIVLPNEMKWNVVNTL